MKKLFNKAAALFLAFVIILGITTSGGLSENYSFLHALKASAEEAAEPESLSVTEETQPAVETPEDFTTDLKDILREYDTGAPVSITFDVEDVQTNDDGEAMISAEQFSEITGDTCATGNTNDGIMIQHDDYSVILNAEDNIMKVNDDELSYLASPPTEKNNEFYFPVEDVAQGLGYSVTENDGEITLTREYQTKRILVKTEVKPTDIQEAVATATVVDDIYAMQYSSEMAAENACEYYSSLENVVYAQPDTIVTVEEEKETTSSTTENTNDILSTTVENTQVTTNLPDENTIVGAQTNGSGTYYSWGAQAMGVDNYAGYLENTVGVSNLNDVVIAVLDTGIDTDHPWFSGRIANNGANYSASPGAYEDVYGHGTHVSGIVCDLTLSNVKILPVKVMNDKGIGYTSSIIQGIYYVIAQKQSGQNIYAMNCSFGMGGAPAQVCDEYQNAISSAYIAGILTVVSAGNSSSDASNFAPANTESAITVSAVGKVGSTYTRPYWSNYGSYIDLSAPGLNIESARCGGGTVLMSGTSMAAPHVAAAVALLYSNSLKTYTLPGIENALDYFSKDLGTPGWDKYFGEGLVSLEYAYLSSMAPVVFSQTTRDFTSAFSLTLSCDEPGSQIYYTLDGSTPSYSNGTLYTGAINIGNTVRVKAIAYLYEDNILTKRSKISSMIYCFNGQDVANAFIVSDTGELTAYLGVLMNVTVPSSVNGINVTSIGEFAFSAVQNDVICVTLPATVTAINDRAFAFCLALTTVYAPSVTKIGVNAFNNCSSFMYLQDLYFPELLKIGKYAFYCCGNLQPISLSRVTFIDDWAFDMANIPSYELTKITLPAVKTIGYKVFFNCSYLTEIDIPNAEIVGPDSFRSCNIKVLVLPSAKYIGSSAFMVNYELTSADMPEAIFIDKSCFLHLDFLSSVNIPKAEKIGEFAFGYCTILANLNMPSVQEIFYLAFYQCDYLETVNAPKLKYISDQAFRNCDSLEEVYLPSVISIGHYAFGWSESLKKVTFSCCIAEIDSQAFEYSKSSAVFYLYGGTAAESFAISNGYTYVDLALNDNCFEYEIINNTEVYITGYTENLPANAEIPPYIEGLPVTKICANAFKNCTQVVRLAVSGLKEIEQFAFSGCSNLKEISLLNVDTIPDNAFYGCTGLNSVEITSAKVVGAYSFYGCTSLLSVELGAEINFIGTKAFGYGADDLVIPGFAIYGYAGTAAESYAAAHNLLFHPKYSPLSFYYYNYYQNNGNKEIYISYVNKDVIGNIIIPSSYNGYTISKIGDLAFSGCCFITGVKLPSTIKTIGAGAFSSCSYMETINCESVTSLPLESQYGLFGAAFSNCFSLKSISLPLIHHITESCFNGCSSLTEAYLPLVTVIDENAFKDCSDLKKVISPLLAFIGDKAFYENIRLQSIDLQNVTTLGESSFSYCTSLRSVFLLKTTGIGGSVFNACSGELTLYAHKGSVVEAHAAVNKLRFKEVESIVTAVNNTVVDNDKFLIYGLTPGITSLDGYISEMPDEFETTYTETLNGFGTGTAVEVKLFGDIVSKLTIVIFGDVTGDGSIDAGDAVKCLDVQNWSGIWNPGTEACYLKAADVNGDGNVDSADADIISDAANLKISLDQTTGEAAVSTGSTMLRSEALGTPASISAKIQSGDVSVLSYTSGYYTYTVSNSQVTITKYNGPESVLTVPDTLGGYPVVSIGSNAFKNISFITAVTIGNTVTTIGISAFQFCTGLTTLNFGNAVSTIGASAFQSCSGLKTLTIGSAVFSIGASAFQSCSGLTSLTIPDTVIIVGDYAFSSCDWLTTVNIGSGVSNIGAYAFNSCTKLTQFIVDSNNDYFSSLDGVLFNKTKTTLIQCPGGKTGDCVIPDGVLNIGNNAFNRCALLTSITISKTVTTIGSSVFILCTAMNRYFVDSDSNSFSSRDDILFNKAKTSLIQCPYNKAGNYVIPNTVVEICDNAFGKCIKLTGIEIQNGVTSIGVGAFSGCSGLTEMNIPDSVISIGMQAFYSCTSLISLTIGSGLNIIGGSAFCYCSNLTGAYFWGNAPATMGSSFFSGCAAGFKVYYINGKTGFTNPWNGYTTAIFSPVSITFDSNGGSAVSSLSRPVNTTVAKPQNPVKDWYSFGGWYSDSGLTTAVNWPFTVVSDVTLYAKWNIIISYMITFDANGGSGGISTLVIAGEIPAQPVVARTGYTFAGWLPAVAAATEPATYVAQWTANIYTIAYNGNSSTSGSTADSAHIFDISSNLTLNGFTKMGNSFLGWSSDLGASSAAYMDRQSVLNLTPIQGDVITFYAVWEANQYLITFEANGGTGGWGPTLMQFGVVLTAPAVTRTGYTFTGWSPPVPENVPAEDSTYTAQWSVINCTIVFDANGGINGSSSSMTYGDPLTAPAVTRTGHTFICWSPSVPETVPAENSTYTAVWDDSFLITFDPAGGFTGRSVYMNAGEVLMAPAVVKTGYTFNGWSPSVPSSVPSENSTYIAQWSANTYTVTYNGNGSTLGNTESSLHTYDVSANLTPNDFVKIGNSFLGWSADSGASIASCTDRQSVMNLTPDPNGVINFYAIWAANQYTITFNANGGRGGSSGLMTYGTALTAPTVSRTNYRFAGWLPEVPATVPPANTTYTAQWIENMYYKYTIINSKTIITEYIGPGGDVTVPDQLGGYDVVKIDENAFNNCTLLTGITIGSGITSIGDRAFANCTGLTTVNLGNGVSSIGLFAFGSCGKMTQFVVAGGNNDFSSRDGVLFNKTQTTLIQCPGGKTGDYVIPDGVLTVADNAFNRCALLTSVTFSNSVKAIGTDAFIMCSAMNRFIADSESKSYSSQDDILFNKEKTELVFCPANKTGNYIIPDTVTEICEKAFYECSKLTGVEIQNGVVAIGDYAFYKCSGLTGIAIPNSVKSIGSNAFNFCRGLRYLTMGSGLTSIGDHAFYSCSGLTSLNVGSSVTDIGSSAFSGCEGLTQIALPNSLISIGASAFSVCNGLTKVVIPNSVISIGNGAFQSCLELTKVTIGNQVEMIDSGAFSDCKKIMTAVFLGNAPIIEDVYVFSDCASGFQIYYISGKTGFTNPWNGYAAAPLTVTVTFNANGGSGGTSGVKTAGGTLAAPVVAKQGYTFSGWLPSVPATVPIENATYTAQWTVYKAVTVTFDANGGIGGMVMATAWGALFSAPAVSRSGYQFAGWEPAVPANVPSENTTYTAQWIYEGSIDINLEAGRFNAATNTFIPLHPGEALSTGDVLTVRICPENDFLVGATRYIVMFSKEYFSVVGSNKTAFTPNLNNAFYSAVAPDYSGTTNIPQSAWPATFTASENYNNYSAVAVNNRANTNSANGGYPGTMPGDWLFSFDLQVTQNIAAGTDAKIWMDNRWVRTSENTSGASYFTKCLDNQYSSLGDSVSYNYDVNMADADIKLPLAGTTQSSTISFNTDGGSAVDPITGYAGDMVTPPAEPAKTGFTFLGWSPALPQTYPGENLNVTAQWRVNSYTVTFDANGGTGGTISSLDYGVSLTPPSVTRVGYSLTGWSPEVPATVGLGNVTYTAQWRICYTLGDVNDNGSITPVDALMALQASSEKITLTENQSLAADVNLSGTVTPIDSLKILQFASGRIASF